jgi:hypothetical protein
MNSQNEDRLVSSGVASGRGLTGRDPSFPERSPLLVGDVIDICFTTTCFQFEDKFCQQKEGMAMGNSLSPVVSNIVFMAHSEEAGLETRQMALKRRRHIRGAATRTSKVTAIF